MLKRLFEFYLGIWYNMIYNSFVKKYDIVLQVYRDRETCLRIDGGFCSRKPIVTVGTWSQEFNLAREYYFKW